MTALVQTTIGDLLPTITLTVASCILKFLLVCPPSRVGVWAVSVSLVGSLPTQDLVAKWTSVSPIDNSDFLVPFLIHLPVMLHRSHAFVSPVATSKLCLNWHLPSWSPDFGVSTPIDTFLMRDCLACVLPHQLSLEEIPHWIAPPKVSSVYCEMLKDNNEHFHKFIENSDNSIQKIEPVFKTGWPGPGKQIKGFRIQNSLRWNISKHPTTVH